jgi:hypothetical protein
VTVPNLTDQHRSLHRFAGQWAGTMTYAPQKNVVYRTIARVALDGRAVIADDEQEENGLIAFRAHRVFGYHTFRQVFTYHFFDSEGATPLACAQGGWEGDTLRLEQQTPFGLVRYAFSFRSDAEYEYQMDVSGDGNEWALYMSGVFRQIGP